MTGFSFFELLGENILTFIFSIIIAVTVYLFIANKIAASWMNPLKFNIFTAGIGIGVVVFLFFTGNVSYVTFLYILVSSFIFWSIFSLVFGNKQKNILINISKERYFADRLFWILYILYISLTLFSYQRFGIPIFNDNSRLAVYTNSGGFGIIQRVQPLMYTYSVFYLFYMYYSHKCTWIRLLFFFSPLIIIGMLSGSRSSFISFIFAYWGVRTFYFNEEPKLGKYKKVLIPFLIISVLTFYLQSSNINTAIISFGERIVACGDLYWEALPDEAWKEVDVKESLKFIMMGLLGPMRILDASQSEIPIGFQLTNIIYPGYDKMTGPVALFPVGSLILYGYIGGLVLTIVQALVTSFLYRMTYVRSNSIIICAMCYYMFTEFIPWVGDIAAGMSVLFNVGCSMTLVFSILLLIGFCAKFVKYL